MFPQEGQRPPTGGMDELSAYTKNQSMLRAARRASDSAAQTAAEAEAEAEAAMKAST